jgi:chromosomal replication initiation ATPase DnaA
MLRHVLAIVKPTRYARRRVEVRDVIAAACRMLSVEPTVLLSGVRTRSVADARGLVVAAARRLTGRSLAAIARDLCMDDNTALKAGRRGETDPLLPDLLAELMSKRNVPHFGERGPRP